MERASTTGTDPRRRAVGRAVAAAAVALVALVSLPLGTAAAAPGPNPPSGLSVDLHRSAPATVSLAVSDGRHAVASRAPRLLAAFLAAWCIVLLTASYVRLLADRSRWLAPRRRSGARAPPLPA